MEKKNLMPQQAQPIERITTGQLPDVLAELSEESLGGSTSSGAVLPMSGDWPLNGHYCSYDGEEDAP